jgi:hypothetical protein
VNEIETIKQLPIGKKMIVLNLGKRKTSLPLSLFTIIQSEGNRFNFLVNKYKDLFVGGLVIPTGKYFI